MGWLSGGEGGVREHERHESYLWVVSVGVGDGRKRAGNGSSERRRSARRFRTPARPSGGRAARSCDQHGGAKQVRPSALRRGTRRRPAACSSMPAAAWLRNERGNDVNAMERDEHEHQ